MPRAAARETFGQYRPSPAGGQRGHTVRHWVNLLRQASLRAAWLATCPSAGGRTDPLRAVPMRAERRVHVEERGGLHAVALAEAHGVPLEGLELDPLAVRQVVVKRRGGIGADRVEDRHALIGVVVG